MLALRMKKAVRKGATLVVCDPRKIWLTKIAKRHLQLQPGTVHFVRQPGGDTLMWQASTWAMNPTIDQRVVDEALIAD